MDEVICHVVAACCAIVACFVPEQHCAAVLTLSQTAAASGSKHWNAHNALRAAFCRQHTDGW